MNRLIWPESFSPEVRFELTPMSVVQVKWFHGLSLLSILWVTSLASFSAFLTGGFEQRQHRLPTLACGHCRKLETSRKASSGDLERKEDLSACEMLRRSHVHSTHKLSPSVIFLMSLHPEKGWLVTVAVSLWGSCLRALPCKAHGEAACPSPPPASTPYPFLPSNPVELQ